MTKGNSRSAKAKQTARVSFFRNLCYGLILAFLAVLPANAQSTVSTMGVGVAFAPIGGHGFSFRKLPVAGFGFQGGTIFWKSNGDSYLNLGAEVLYVLKHTRLTSFYIPAGVGLTYQSQLQYRYDPNLPNQNQEFREKTTSLTGGAGLGFTARTESWEDLWFSLDLVMAVSENDILPLPQFAIHYFFK